MFYPPTIKGSYKYMLQSEMNQVSSSTVPGSGLSCITLISLLNQQVSTLSLVGRRLIVLLYLPPLSAPVGKLVGRGLKPEGGAHVPSTCIYREIPLLLLLLLLLPLLVELLLLIAWLGDCLLCFPVCLHVCFVCSFFCFFFIWVCLLACFVC